MSDTLVFVIGLVVGGFFFSGLAVIGYSVLISSKVASLEASVTQLNMTSLMSSSNPGYDDNSEAMVEAGITAYACAILKMESDGDILDFHTIHDKAMDNINSFNNDGDLFGEMVDHLRDRLSDEEN